MAKEEEKGEDAVAVVLVRAATEAVGVEGVGVMLPVARCKAGCCGFAVLTTRQAARIVAVAVAAPLAGRSRRNPCHL